MSAPELEAELPSHPGAALQVMGLAKHFGERTVLGGISFELSPGSFTAIVGQSGCGKSTLLRLLADLEQRDAGVIRLSRAQSQGGPPPAPTKVRMVFQDGRLLPWRSVLDNVGLGCRGHWRPRAQALLREVGLSGRERDFPRVLSGGQRQRVAFARALLHEPDLLLLDEPLGALDALTRLQMQELLARIWERHRFTALLVTHDVSEAVALADKILILDRGHLERQVEVALPRPRIRQDASFQALGADVLSSLLGASP